MYATAVGLVLYGGRQIAGERRVGIQRGSRAMHGFQKLWARLRELFGI
jgi:hypothetical protein